MPLYPDDDWVRPEPPTDPPGVPTPTPYQRSFKSSAQSPGPFIRLGNVCVHIERIVSVEFLPNAALYRVGDHVIYKEITAEHEAELLDKSMEKFNTPVLFLKFINTNDMKETIRRWGEEAEVVWEYIINNLAAP